MASFLIATVCVECGKTMALTAYGAVSLLSLLFVPDKEVALTFVFLLGYYPLASLFERIRPALLRLSASCCSATAGSWRCTAGAAAGPGGQHRRRAAHYGAGRLAGDAGHGQCSFLLYDRALHNMLMLYKVVWQPRLHKMLGVH